MARRTSRTVVVGGPLTDTQVLGPNPDRISITLAPPTGGSYFYAFAGEASATTGMHMPSTASTLVLTREEIGELIVGPLRIGVGGGVTLAIMECFNVHDAEDRP